MPLFGSRLPQIKTRTAAKGAIRMQNDHRGGSQRFDSVDLRHVWEMTTARKGIKVIGAQREGTILKR